ncbi:MAG: glycerol-3-phosphate 1-O-acyltransferase PlsY [Verrucomicrobiota bacterium]
MTHVATAVAGYLLGSIPTGFLVAKAKGVDIRSVGSGNIGATNVFRILGKGAGTFVLLVDALKGFLACGLVANLAYQVLGIPEGLPGAAREYLSITGGVAAILGHNYTCWLGFKGGKGIATSAGVLLALVPLAFVFALGTWLLVFAVSLYVSVASIAAALVLPFATWYASYSPTMIAITTFMSALAIYKHRTNIQRLLNGTENRIGSPKTEDKPKS